MGLNMNDISNQIRGANDENTLNQLSSFIASGEQNQDNQFAQQVLAQRRAEIAAQAEAQKQQAAANEVRGQLNKQAKDYRSKVPQIQEQTFNPVADESRRALAGQISGIRTSANSRGLLYSGLRQGSESQARGDMSAGLAAKRAQINEHTNAQADAYDTMAQQGNADQQNMIMDEAKRRQGNADEVYNQALARRSGKQAITNSAFQAGGQIAGAAAGGFAGRKA